jgi:hypothetical protein
MGWISRRKFLGQAGALSGSFIGLAKANEVLAQAGRTQGGAATAWQVSGGFIDACNCDVLCPCVFSNAPTRGDCASLVAWHVEDGRFNDLSLNGLNAAWAFYTPAHVLKGNWKLAVYVDEQGTPAQREALGAIFSGRAGGYLGGVAPLIGQLLGIRAVPIQFEVDGRRRQFIIPGIARVAITAVEGGNKTEVLLQNTPLGLVPDLPVVVAKSNAVSYGDYDLAWKLSDTNGFYGPFSYAAS